MIKWQLIHTYEHNRHVTKDSSQIASASPFHCYARYLWLFGWGNIEV